MKKSKNNIIIHYYWLFVVFGRMTANSGNWKFSGSFLYGIFVQNQ